jgi:hypothetical protein
MNSKSFKSFYDTFDWLCNSSSTSAIFFFNRCLFYIYWFLCTFNFWIPISWFKIMIKFWQYKGTLKLSLKSVPLFRNQISNFSKSMPIWKFSEILTSRYVALGPPLVFLETSNFEKIWIRVTYWIHLLYTTIYYVNSLEPSISSTLTSLSKYRSSSGVGIALTALKHKNKVSNPVTVGMCFMFMSL